jgi:hypothetical protein
VKFWDTAKSTDNVIDRGFGYQNIVNAGAIIDSAEGDYCNRMIYNTFEGVPGMSDENPEELSAGMLNYLLKNVIVEKNGKIKANPADNPMADELDSQQRSAVAALRESLLKKKKALEGTYKDRKREDNSPEYNAMKDALDEAVKATNLNNGKTLNELLSALSNAERTAKAYEKIERRMPQKIDVFLFSP